MDCFHQEQKKVVIREWLFDFTLRSTWVPRGMMLHERRAQAEGERAWKAGASEGRGLMYMSVWVCVRLVLRIRDLA